MTKITMGSMQVMKFFPVLFLCVAGFIYYNEPDSLPFLAVGSILIGAMLFSSKSRIMFKLADIYIDDKEILVRKSFSTDSDVTLPRREALLIEYQQLGNQIVGKFWFLDPICSERKFVYFCPIKSEAKWETSELYMACFSASLIRDEEKHNKPLNADSGNSPAAG